MMSSTTTVLNVPLDGLNCMGCARKVQAAIEALPGVLEANGDKHQVDIATSGSGDFSLDAAFEEITKLGYRAGRSFSLPLAGLSCGKCVAKLTLAFESSPDVVSVSITKEQADITGLLTKADAVAIIESQGYAIAPTKTDNDRTAPEPDKESSISANDSIEQSTDSVIKAGDSKQYMLTGMTCASCVASVEKAMLSVPGVEYANVNLAERTAQVGGTFDNQTLVDTVDRAGYAAELSEDEQTRRQKQALQHAALFSEHKRNTWLSLGLGAPLMLWGLAGGTMGVATPQSRLGWAIVAIVTLILLMTAGRHFFTNAWKAFLHHRASMDTLVALGTGSAWLYSAAVVAAPQWFPEQARHVYFEASAMILGLVTLGHALEAKARASTSSALDRLLDLQPQEAQVVIDGLETSVPLASVTAGMLVRIKPGAKIPVDGIVTEGSSYFDESMLTGEPMAVAKKAGDTIHAGTVNQNGSVLYRATGVGSDTMLSRIVQLVRQAQGSKPALAKMADKISAIFVPTVMIIAIATALLWYNIGPDPKLSYMLVTATTVLIIACPCALGLATPMSVTTGVGRAAELGVLVRDAEALQHAANIDTVVLDKTGTLTEGRPSVTTLYAYDAGTQSPDNGHLSSNRLLQLAASLEQQSEHPLAKAVIEEAKQRGLPLSAVSDFNIIPGMGIEASIDGQSYLLGNAALMANNDLDTAQGAQESKDMARRGETAIYLANQKNILAIVGISDPLRKDSIDAVSRLKQSGYQVMMLTGDHPDTANAIASLAGIENVIAGVLPDGKEAEISKLQQQGLRVAMVGDGINDAPALAKAEVGIAMGSGSDVAIESAQITLMRHSVDTVADALLLSRATLRNMKQNLFGAFIYNSLGIPIAAGLLYPLTGSLLSPVVAGAAMALSSITVVSNANRLRWFQPATRKSHHDS